MPPSFAMITTSLERLSISTVVPPGRTLARFAAPVQAVSADARGSQRPRRAAVAGNALERCPPRR
jgi:hypothetical protein